MKKQSQSNRHNPRKEGLSSVSDEVEDQALRSLPTASDSHNTLNNNLLHRRNAFPFSWGHGLFFLLGMLAILCTQRLFSKQRHEIILPGLVSEPTRQLSAWGSLEYTSIELERPDNTLAAMPAFNPVVKWQFESMEEEQVKALFQRLEIPQPMAARLLDKNRWQKTATGVAVTPGEEILLQLNPSARKAVYEVLAQSASNFSQQNPVRIPSEKIDSWVNSSGLCAQNQLLFRKLLYPQGSDLLFSDYETLASRCTVEERKLFAKASSRIEALVASLKINHETDIDALVKYWGGWTGGQQMIPFMQALAAVPGGTSISVSYLFPPFARLRLYTYPQNTTNTADYHEDCFWTAMNFFNEKPDNRFCTPRFIMETLRNEYLLVTGERAFGDVLLLTQNNGKAVHMCVHIADDVVFTKNGAHALQPWVLMRLPEMMRQYNGDDPVQIRSFRRKSK